MDLKKIFNNNKAVSPVIGVVLMVAITVILAAAIGSSVFGQGPSESAPQANINIVAADSTHIKLEHLGGDTILFNEGSTKIILANSQGTYELDFTRLAANLTDNAFDVGMTGNLELTTNVTNSSAVLTQPTGGFATVKVVDVKTKQLIADKELRF
jgi:archaeal type IV pilus assembly protein PilA